MSFQLKLSHKGIFLISVPLIFELLFVIVLAVMLKQAQDESQLQTVSKEVVASANNLSNVLLEGAYALINWKALRSSIYIDEYKKCAAQVPDLLNKLDELGAGNATRREHIDKIKLYANRIVYLTSNFSQPEGIGALMLMDIRTHALDLQRNFREFLSEVKSLDEEEARVQAENPATSKDLQFRLYFLLVVAVAFNIALTVVLALFFSKRITDRLEVLTDNAKRLAQRKTLNDPVAGDDEIAQLDQVFHQVASDLTKAEQRKQEFVSMISHDLRTPLTTLQTTLALIEDNTGDTPEQMTPRIVRARRNITRMIELIGQLLDMDKLDAGMLTIYPEPADLAAIIDRAVEALRDLAQQKGVRITHLPVNILVNADQERLTQILVNLLGNALKFSPAGGEIDIDVQFHEKFAKVSIIDKGPGIPQSDLKRIFDRFHQVHTNQTRKSEGTGLGLAICKALVEAHHGQIGVESDGLGSTFWFTIPRV
jgi:signal transduction histidine kinase